MPKVVVCSQAAPLALYDKGALAALGEPTVDKYKLIYRTDTLHSLSYLGPLLQSGAALEIGVMERTLLIAGMGARLLSAAAVSQQLRTKGTASVNCTLKNASAGDISVSLSFSSSSPSQCLDDDGGEDCKVTLDTATFEF